jgi:acetolactate synthase I/III small subunit
MIPLTERSSTAQTAIPQPGGTLLELVVRNHSSVLARLVNLCARRAYSIEALFCPPAPHAAQRSLWLLLEARCSLEQIERQLLKLEDVHAVRRHSRDMMLMTAVGAR